MVEPSTRTKVKAVLIGITVMILRHTLNVLAEVAPDWLRAQALPAE